MLLTPMIWNAHHYFHKGSVCGLLIFLFQIQTQNFAQSQTMQEIGYEGIYVLFESECCGIDRKGFDYLQDLMQKFNKKTPPIIQQKVVHWGKEGERLVYLVAKHLQDDEFQKFSERLLSDFQKKAYPLITSRSMLQMEETTHKLWLHFPPYGILKNLEDECLFYISTFESKKNLKISTGAMINETHLEKDQDKRYELDLSKLSQKQQDELILKLKAILVDYQE